MKKLFTKRRTVMLAAVPVIACAILWVAKRATAKKGAEPWCASFLRLTDATVPLGAEKDIMWREKPRVDPPAILPPFDVRPNN